MAVLRKRGFVGRPGRKVRPYSARLFAALMLAVAAIVPAFASAPVRVVSQAVGTDELLLAVAATEQIAALSHISRDPQFSAVAKEAETFPHINQGDAETILRFQPTLVLFTSYSRAELVAQVRRAGVRVLIYEKYESLPDVFAFLRVLGRELDRESAAEQLIARCEQRVAALHTRLTHATPVRVIAPSTYGLVPGSDTTFQDLCEHAAAENLAATLGKLSGHVPPPSEAMLLWPVEFVVVAGANLDAALAPFRKLPPYQFMPAVQENRAVVIAPWMLSCVSHRRIDGYERLARALHPEAFE